MRRRVLISILLVIAATVLTLGVPLSIVSWRVVDDLMHSDLSSRLESIAASIANQSGSSEIDLGQLEAAVPAGGRLDIRMAGRIDQSIGAPPSDQVYSEQLAMAGGGLLRLAVPESYLRAEQWTALALVGLAVLLSVVVGTGVALLTAGRLVTPLTDVARRAARLGSGDFRTFRRRYGIAELDRVADVLDSSAQDIAALIARERDLAGDISHQLRTRLTGLRLRLEELAEHPDPAGRRGGAGGAGTDRPAGHGGRRPAGERPVGTRGGGQRGGARSTNSPRSRRSGAPRLAEAGRALTGALPAGHDRCTPRPGRLREAIGVLVENSLRHGAGPVGITVRTATRGSGGDGGARGQRRGPRHPGGTGRARLRSGGVDGVVHRYRAWVWRGRSSRPTVAGWSCAGRRRRSSRSSWRWGRARSDRETARCERDSGSGLAQSAATAVIGPARRSGQVGPCERGPVSATCARLPRV